MVQLVDLGPIMAANSIASNYFKSFVKIIPSPRDNRNCLSISLTKQEEGYQLLVVTGVEIQDFLEAVAKNDVHIDFERKTYCNPISLWPGSMPEHEEGKKEMDCLLQIVFLKSLNRMREVADKYGLGLFDNNVKVFIPTEQQEMGMETMGAYPLVSNSLTKSTI